MASIFRLLTSQHVVHDGTKMTSACAAFGSLMMDDGTTGKVKPTSGSTVAACGFMLPANQLTYRPTTNDVRSTNVYVTILKGHGIAQASLDAFLTTPALGDLIFPAAGGLMTVASAPTGVYPIGRIDAVDVVTAGIGFTTANLYRFTFSIPQYATN